MMRDLQRNVHFFTVCGVYSTYGTVTFSLKRSDVATFQQTCIACHWIRQRQVPRSLFFFYVMTTGYYNIIFEVIIVVLQRHRYRRRSQRTSKTVAAAEVEIMACGGYDRSIILAKRGGRGGCRPTLNRSLS